MYRAEVVAKEDAAAARKTKTANTMITNRKNTTIAAKENRGEIAHPAKKLETLTSGLTN